MIAQHRNILVRSSGLLALYLVLILSLATFLLTAGVSAKKAAFFVLTSLACSIASVSVTALRLHAQRSVAQYFPLVAFGVFLSAAVPVALWPLVPLTLLFVLVLILCRYRTLVRSTMYPLCALLVWYGQYERQFGAPSPEHYAAIFQSNSMEGVAYFFAFLGGMSVWTIIGVIVSIETVLWLGVPRGIRRAMHVFVIFSVFAGVQLLSPLQTRLNLAREGITQYAAVLNTLKGGRLAPITGEFTGAGRRVIFVLGESSSRAFWPEYGYFRASSSFKPSMYIHGDTISQYSHTVPSVTSIFYRKTGADTASLFDRLHKHGVRTAWYSNQSRFGAWDNPVALIADRANYVHFESTYKDGFISRYFDETFDENLLRQLQRETGRDGASLEIIHLMAGHAPYCRYIPGKYCHADAPFPSSAFFGAASDRADDAEAYEGTQRYVRHVISKVVEIAKSERRPTIVIYASDHGEAVLLGTQHNSAQHSSYHVEIPHLWYFNDAARTLFRREVVSFEANQQKPFFLPWIRETLLELFELAEPAELKRSIVSDQFTPGLRVVSPGGPYEVNYDDLRSDAKDYRELSRLVMNDLRKNDKNKWNSVYAHRVDTLGKLFEARRLFSGVELDIVFNAELRKFFVYHPPAKNIGIMLDDYLRMAADNPDLHFWFDWKKAEPQHIHAALEELDRLNRLFSIKKRSLIETEPERVYSELREVALRGYEHLYYVPVGETSRCAITRREAACQTLGATILKNARIVGATALSFDHLSAPFVNGTPELAQYPAHTWDLSVSSTDRDLNERLQQLGKARVMLINFPSIFFN